MDPLQPTLGTLPAAPVGKGIFRISWALSGFVAFMLLMSAAMKLSLSPQVVEGFAHFGFSAAAIRPIGFIELVCVALYLIPRTSVLGAILMTGYLGGAVVTHLRVGEPALVGGLILGVCAWLALWLREPRLHALLPLRGAR